MKKSWAGPLARLIAKASRRSQVVVVSHARALAEALRAEGADEIALTKHLGETLIEGDEAPAWKWPVR